MKVVVYADGAVKNNGSPDGGRIGMGAVLMQELLRDPDGKMVSRSRYASWSMDLDRATNIRAELEAIYRSLLLIKDELVPRVTVEIHTDSEWSIRALTGVYQKVSYYPELRGKILERLQQFKGWEFGYVRGHAGHQFNEQADELASRAAGTWKKAGTRLPTDYEQYVLEDE